MAEERRGKALISTRRKVRGGTVHEMADLGMDFLCGRTATEPFNWTEDPITCQHCLAKAEAEVAKELADVYRPEGIEIWLGSPHKSFGGRSARDLIRTGERDRVLQEIEMLQTGAFG